MCVALPSKNRSARKWVALVATVGGNIVVPPMPTKTKTKKKRELIILRHPSDGSNAEIARSISTELIRHVNAWRARNSLPPLPKE
jgi:hypothetical protein